MAKRHMKLGMSKRGLGYHVAAWSHSDPLADGTLRVRELDLPKGKIMLALRPSVGATRAEAKAKHDELQEPVEPLVGLARAYDALGDLSDVPVEAQVRSSQGRLMKHVRENDWTIRQLCQHLAGEGGSPVIGTAADICDRMEEWMDAKCCDGFNITPNQLPGGCEDFARFVTPYVNRYVAQRRTARMAAD